MHPSRRFALLASLRPKWLRLLSGYSSRSTIATGSSPFCRCRDARPASCRDRPTPRCSSRPTGSSVSYREQGGHHATKPHHHRRHTHHSRSHRRLHCPPHPTGRCTHPRVGQAVKLNLQLPPSPRATTPSLAAQRLLRAWQAQHRAAALQLASGQAVDAVFARPPRSLRNPTLTGCFNRAGGYDCAYSAGLTWLRMRIEGGASAGYRVQRAMFADRISNPATSARLLYQAWAADDRWAALAWGSPNAVQTLFGLHRDRYALTGCELGQTSFICHWKARGYGIRMDVAGGA